MLDPTMRDRLQKVFPNIGVAHDATDWLDVTDGADRIYVDTVQPSASEAMEARAIMLAAGIPSVYFRAAENGLLAYDDVTGDPNPTTTWWLGATPAP